MSTNPPSHIVRPAGAGFTLVEVAIVLLIIGFVATAGLVAVQAQADNQQVRDNQRLLEDAREALIGFAASHPGSDAGAGPFLPCPDKTGAAGAGTANDGQEDRITPVGTCVALEGNLPWVTLGLAESTDRWGYHLRYQVSAPFSNGATGMTLLSTGGITIFDAATGGTTLAGEVPAVILSHGKNGLGAITTAGVPQPTTGAGADELENTDGDTTFVSHSRTEAGAAGGAFDDQVVWLSRNILFNRMLQAGRLP
ncbi:MAG TPA: type II secretion system protein [Rhodocyclaceae bacterium]|nr:type II secretion system protein [Rhodocyclaceae bacterium]